MSWKAGPVVGGGLRGASDIALKGVEQKSRAILDQMLRIAGRGSADAVDFLHLHRAMTERSQMLLIANALDRALAQNMSRILGQ